MWCHDWLYHLAGGIRYFTFQIVVNYINFNEHFRINHFRNNTSAFFPNITTTSLLVLGLKITLVSALHSLRL